MKKLFALLIAAGCLTSYNVMAEEGKVELVVGRSIALSTGDAELDKELEKLPKRERRREIIRIRREKARIEAMAEQENSSDENVQVTIEKAQETTDNIKENILGTEEKVSEVVEDVAEVKEEVEENISEVEEVVSEVEESVAEVQEEVKENIAEAQEKVEGAVEELKANIALPIDAKTE